jgi:hypothetical protein
MTGVLVAAWAALVGTARRDDDERRGRGQGGPDEGETFTHGNLPGGRRRECPEVSGAGSIARIGRTTSLRRRSSRRDRAQGLRDRRRILDVLQLAYQPVLAERPAGGPSPDRRRVRAALNLLAASAGPAEDVLGINGGHPDATKGRSGFGARR